MNYYPLLLRQEIQIQEIYSIHYFENYKNYFFPGERHNFWELVYVDRGEITVETDLLPAPVRLEQGDLIFYRPNEFHRFYADDIMPHNLFVVSFECYSQPLIKVTEQTVFHLRSEAKSQISSIINEAKKCFSTSLQDPNVSFLQRSADAPFGSEQIIKLMLELLLILICRGDTVRSDEDAQRGKQARISENYVENAIEFLKGNLRESIALSDVCVRVGVSRSQLQKIFKRSTGKSVMSYLKELRLEEAKFLIRRQSFNFTEISQQLCFSTVHHFSHRFKEYTAMSPTEYARSILSLTQNSDLPESWRPQRG